MATATKKAATRKAVKKSAATKGRTMISAGNSELAKLFLDEIKDIYWAEKKLVKTLPKMQKAASTQELKQAIGNHLEETKEHVSRLEQVFELLEHRAVAKKCDAMEGLTTEGESIIEDTDDGTLTRDVGIIMAAQKVEHYEIATYGSLRQLATVLGYKDIAQILETTLEEEKNADETLSSIAENDINYEAAGEG